MRIESSHKIQKRFVLLLLFFVWLLAIAPSQKEIERQILFSWLSVVYFTLNESVIGIFDEKTFASVFNSQAVCTTYPSTSPYIFNDSENMMLPWITCHVARINDGCQFAYFFSVPDRLHLCRCYWTLCTSIDALKPFVQHINCIGESQTKHLVHKKCTIFTNICRLHTYSVTFYETFS